MSPAVDTNSTPIIHRVRRRNHELHVTYTNGDRVDVGQAVNGRYQSRYPYGATSAAVNVKPLHSR